MQNVIASKCIYVSNFIVAVIRKLCSELKKKKNYKEVGIECPQYLRSVTKHETEYQWKKKKKTTTAQRGLKAKRHVHSHTYQQINSCLQTTS